MYSRFPTARVLTLAACVAVALPVSVHTARAQFKAPEMSKEVRQHEDEMQKLGESFDSAWDLYQHFKEKADGGTIAPKYSKLPDWSGLWERRDGPFFLDPEQTDFNGMPPVELTPKYEQELKERLKRYAAGNDYDPISVCGVPAGFPRFMVEPFMREFVPTPKQTWLINEAGNEVRRIYTDGRGHIPPEAAYPLYEGDSIGFWDGQKLVVHTSQIKGTVLQRIQPRDSDKAETVEIWEKIDDNTIKVDLWIYDQEAFKKPWFSQQFYRKIPNDDGLLRIHFWACAENQNNVITKTGEGGSTFTDFTFTNEDDKQKKKQNDGQNGQDEQSMPWNEDK